MTKTNVSRLEIIKGTPYIIQCDVLFKDFKWLIEQAECVDVLQANLNGTTELLDDTINSLKKMANDNARLREALEYYANEENHFLVDGENTTVGIDSGNLARQALDK